MPRDSASSISDNLAAFNAPFEVRFRGLLRGSDPRELDCFIDEARRSGRPSIQQFARTLTRDIEAVTPAVAEPWSRGQAEAQINRLKAVKRAMYGRAGIELLRTSGPRAE